MKIERNNKASSKLTAAQESALRDATSDYTLSMKHLEVQKNIKKYPVLDEIPPKKLTDYIRNRNKKMKRREKEIVQIETTDQIKVAESEP